MATSAVRSYSDVDAYTGALPSVSIDMTVTRRGSFAAQTTFIELDDVRIQRFRDNLPRIVHADLPAGRAILSFRTQPGPELIWHGVPLLPTTILWHHPQSAGFQRSEGAAEWGSVTMSLERMSEDVATLAGCDLTAPRDPKSLSPSAATMEELQRLHAACVRTARIAPELLINPEVTRGIEQAMTAALARAIASAYQCNGKAIGHQHATVMRRFRAMIEANPDRALYMGEVSAAIGVSGRMLRHCCKEHLGMGANQYLALRRMNMVRRALSRPTVSRSTVTEAATSFGFWELGRFAVGYKALFGEMPSQTLRRALGGNDADHEPGGASAPRVIKGHMLQH